ncbi:YbaB/EbfC family nucleoid-associated protein [Sphingomonas canadensis]|uniref:Nucleoid-associated protein ACFQ1E_06375 n=1 Tax=Sphingomonas canadensis TaxID=1219257 RepID=A0ABW3H3Z5_9SPHN|nr:YbaB/EbfC family nucleoid-associated protein [Sphingomonas canadensis]MCW3835584.1 YbaB/EbfC family nucleoid-associated protein [Sphingomonas canadensis]
MKSLEDIMAMAQNVQAELQKAQANLDSVEVEGVSGGGLVKVRATAKGRIIGMNIDDSLLNPAEKGMLEDLLAAAFNDARAKADAAAQDSMSKMTAGIPLPPGFKLPF